MKAINIKKTMAVVAAVSAIVGVLAYTPESYAANLVASGSTTVFPVANAAAAPFNAATGNTLTVNGGGSGAGAVQIMADQCDIADMSSQMTAAQGLAQMNEVRIAEDAVTFVVNKSLYNAGVQNITTQEIQNIYQNGTNIASLKWSDLRPGVWPSTPVVPIARALTSGTRDCVVKLTTVNDGMEQTTETQVQTTYGIQRYDANADVATAINTGSPAGEIGYVGLGYAFDSNGNPNPTYPNMVALPLQGLASSGNAYPSATYVAPSAQVCLNHTYPEWRYLYMYTRLPQYDPTYKVAALDFVEWMLTPAGQAIVQQQGYVPCANVSINPVKNPAPYWDVNGDGSCNVLDAIPLGMKWNQTVPKGSPEDVNGDGSVNVLDAIPLGQHWNVSWHTYRSY